MNKQPHGQPGHCNIYKLDWESDITNYGKHNPLYVSLDVESGNVYVTERFKWNLPESTEQDRMRVSNGWQRMHPKGTKLIPLPFIDEYNSDKEKVYIYQIVKKVAVKNIYFVEWGKDNTFNEIKVFTKKFDAYAFADSLTCRKLRIIRREDGTMTPDMVLRSVG